MEITNKFFTKEEKKDGKVTEYIYNDISIAKYFFDNEEAMYKAIANIYQKDKQKYLETGVWTDSRFFERNDLWLFYYLLKLIDEDINLDKYLEGNYNSKEWPRERLIDLVKVHGMNILFSFYCYTCSDSKQSFPDWYLENYMYFTLRRSALDWADYKCFREMAERCANRHNSDLNGKATKK